MLEDIEIDMLLNEEDRKPKALFFIVDGEVKHVFVEWGTKKLLAAELKALKGRTDITAEEYAWIEDQIRT